MTRFIPSRFLEIAQARAGNQMAQDARESRELQQASETMRGVMEEFAARQRRQAEIEDVRSALSNPDHQPTTEAGIKASQERKAQETDAARYNDRKTAADEVRTQNKTKFDWEAEDRADKDAAEAELVRMANEEALRGSLTTGNADYGNIDPLGIFDIGLPPPDVVKTPDGVRYRAAQQKAMAEAVESKRKAVIEEREAKRKADIEERETKVKEKSAESMSGRRDVLNERDRAKMATADGVLSDEFPEAKPVTRNGALTAAITILRMRNDPATMKPVEPTTQEVIDKARDIMTGVNAPLNGAPQTSPLDAEGKELFGD